MACDLSECPFCGGFFELSEIEEHVSLHLMQSDLTHLQDPCDAPNSSQPHANHVSTEHVACPFGCGALVALDELDSHEEAHRWDGYDKASHTHCSCSPVRRLL
jgi:hypothetical protein